MNASRFLLASLLGLTLFAASVSSSACGEGECLQYGENCSSAYIADNYDTSISCCEGTTCVASLKDYGGTSVKISTCK